MANTFYNNRPADVGDPNAIKQWSQLPTATNPQQFANNAMLARGLYGMFQPQPNFEPIRQQYMRDYRNNVLPGILSDATNSGWGQGSGFQKAVAGADTDLAYRLAALQQNFNQHQYDQNREQSNQLLQQGMKPQFENMYAPVPYEAAKQHLIRSGILNPTPEEVNKALPQFQSPRMLTAGGVAGGAQDYARDAWENAQSTSRDVKQAYNAGGLKGAGKELYNKAGSTVSNALFGQPQGQGQVQPNAVGFEKASPETISAVEAYKESRPLAGAAIERSLKNQTPLERKISEEVIADLSKVNAPILEQNLSAKDYQILRDLRSSGKPKIARLAELVRTRGELDKLIKYNTNESKFRMGRFLRKLIARQAKEAAQKNQPLAPIIGGGK